MSDRARFMMGASTHPTETSTGRAPRRYHVGIASVCRRWVAVMFVAALAVFSGLQGARAETAELCDTPADNLADTCDVYNTYCAEFLSDPASLDRAILLPIPARAAKRITAGPLNKEVLGFRRTDNDFVSVVYYDDAPSCELLINGAPYSRLVFAFHDWKREAGAEFAAAGNFEPRSKKRLSRAFASVFLAARRPDGRITEITFNWNLSAEGLTRLKVSYQPERDHTAKMLSKGTQ